MHLAEDVGKIIKVYSRPTTNPKWREICPCWVLRCDPVYDYCFDTWRKLMLEVIVCPNVCEFHNDNFRDFFLMI